MTDANEIHAAPAEERGIPSIVGQKRTRMNKVVLAAVALMATTVLAGATAMFVKRLSDQKEAERAEERARPKDSAQKSDATGDLEGTKARIKAQEDAQAAAQTPAPADAGNAKDATGASNSTSTASVAQQSSSAGGQQSGNGHPVQTPAARRLEAGVMVMTADTKDNKAKAADDTAGSTSSATLLGGSGASSGKNALDEQMAVSANSRAPMVRASFLPDLTYLLRKTTMIPCDSSKIVSTYPGGTSCEIIKDVYSANGKTLLIRKGAIAMGEQRSALVQGQARIFAMYTRIDDGSVTIPLDSPVTDPLGGSGIDAYVDNHFWQRFGGALMVGLVGDFGQAFANKTVGSNSATISLSNTSQSTQDVATEALRNTINIPPTGYVNQGTITYIYVARDIDFSSQYELVQGNVGRAQ
ncbi:TrbI/VirB10 family protein [Paraburkholderia susongensis]|uniref:Type IV secretion system protein VirB10 n=1 Tax=Paraburkholderia susongensis TaxID=1515439 RepID=A0A1X7M6F6_9BURK|nr:TrbI/VirB10 family protein [Paraburkholderia susongensis]SMG61560.1 type IV secretion system protein VirB10 [Paraburkholderia susongensis]